MKITLKSEKKIAYDSPDHIVPLGTAQDNSRNYRFNKKIYKLFKNNIGLKILDLGCSGGGFVRDCINDGCFAIGLEGSDYSKKLKRAEWATIPEFLFTCDISKKFKLLLEEKELNFDLITSWEVFEHIREEDLDILIENVKKHLSENGLFIASISNFSDMENGVERHQTQKPKSWWIKKFKEKGFHERKELYGYFNGQYIRGRKEKKDNFHIILSKENEYFNSPKLTFSDRLKDFWVGSRSQIFLKYMINGEVR